MEVGPLARMLVAYASGPRASEGARRVGVEDSSTSGPRRSSPRSAASRRAASRRRYSPRRWSDWVDALAREHGVRRTAHSRQLEVGSRHVAGRRNGRRLPRGAARSARALGVRSTTARSPTTSASFRARGTPVRATRKAAAVRTKRRCSRRRLRTRSGRSKSSVPCTRSIPAWRAVSTSSTRSAMSWRE